MARLFLNDTLKHQDLRMVLVDREPYVDGQALTSILGAEIKIHKTQGLAVICDAESCLPLEIGDGTGGAMFVDGVPAVGLGAVCGFLKFDYALHGNDVKLTTGEQTNARLERENADRLKVGDPMPDFLFPLIPPEREGFGEHVALSRFRGAKLALFAWASY